MPSLKALIVTSVLAFLASAPSAAAAPHPEQSLTGDVKVYIRDAANAYHPSPSMINAIKARGLHKRSGATVQACYTASCTECRTIFDSTLSSNSACISASNTACLIVSNLDDANIKYWNRAGCNGNMSEYGDCPEGTNSVGAAGTNSIGVHTGC